MSASAQDTSGGTGRREANKQATRAALRQAAERLFAEQGYETTTVTQIAEAAGVGERTFYRYFDGKQDLLAERALSWTARLSDAIRARPAAEPPYQAVARAMTALARELTRDHPENEAWLLGTAQPLATLRRVEPRPLRRLEQSIAAAVLARQAAATPGPDAAPPDAAPPDAAPGAGPAPETELEAMLLARVTVATLRTVVLSQRGRGATQTDLSAALADAFSRLSRLTRLTTQPSPGAISWCAAARRR